MAVSFPDFEEYQLNGNWPYDDWSSLCDEIVEAHGSLDRDEVGLMLCCVTGKLPMSLATRAENESRTMKSDLLHQTLTYLKELPANSTQWGGRCPYILIVYCRAISSEGVRTCRRGFSGRIDQDTL